MLANFSPGLSFGNPGPETGDGVSEPWRGLQRLSLARVVVTLSGLGFPQKNTLLIPGLPKLNLALKLANTFGVPISSQ